MDFCINGLIWPDRTPHPPMVEFKKLIQPVAVRAVDLAAGKIEITNKHDFVTLAHLQGRWELAVDGVVVQSAPLPRLSTRPGFSVVLQRAVQPAASGSRGGMLPETCALPWRKIPFGPKPGTRLPGSSLNFPWLLLKRLFWRLLICHPC